MTRGLLTVVPLAMVASVGLLATPALAQPTGYIQVCKFADGPYVSGSFSYTINHAGGSTQTGPVLVGQCSAPLVVDAGNVTVIEAAKANVHVSKVKTYPAGRLVSTNLPARSAVVTVPASASSADETLVGFWNAADTGLLKVCKRLAPNAGDLVGETFTFGVQSAAGYGQVSIVAGAVGTDACKLYPKPLPVGSKATITEHNKANVKMSGIIISPWAHNSGSDFTAARVRIGSTGVTTAIFTNEALGTLQVCKVAADAPTASTTWGFQVNGGSTIWVPAGQCSQPITLPVGTATVKELSQPYFVLQSVEANGDRLLTGPKTNPAKVEIPFGGSNAGGNETLVTFTNRVATAQLKICKLSSEQSLQGYSFNFTYQTTNDAPGSGSANLKPGQCSAPSSKIALLDAEHDKTEVSVTENNNDATIAVSDIHTTGDGHLVSSDNSTKNAVVDLGSRDGGITTVWYTNVRTPPAQ